MSLRINTNTAAMDAYRSLSTNQSNLQDAFQKLSSGLRINKAADDASGLAISQGLTSQINGLTQAVSNANDGINVAQIADGAMATQQSILQRMNTLAVQASNGTQDTNSLAAIQSEVVALNAQLDSISASTAFGGKTLLDGTNSSMVFQVGATSASTDQVTLTLSATDSSSLGTSGVDMSTTSGAQAALATIATALSTLSTDRAGVGATQNQLNYTVSNLQSTIQNVTASRSNITDADLATEVTTMTQAQILTSAATSVLAQANSAPQSILKLLQ
ncbi:flagellin [Frankineae bacterium MT45]|nr:flagellin [Frankineae bacterium MT45]